MKKKVIRLTETELRNLVSNIISEQMAAPAVTKPAPAANEALTQKVAWGVANQLIKAIEGPGTDEDMVLRAVMGVMNQQVYNYLLRIVQTSPTFKKQTGSNYKTVMDYINTDFQIPYFDKPMKGDFRRPNDSKFSAYNDDRYSKKTSTQIPKKCMEHLQKFNKNEYMDVQIDYDSL